MSVRVKMQPEEIEITSGNGTKYKVVAACTVSLENMGSGTTPAGAATLEFWEMPDIHDQSTTPRKLGFLQGELDPSVPKFKETRVQAIEHDATLLGPPGDPKSDFRLIIETNSDTIEWGLTGTSLRLPWEVEEEARKFEVGVKLLVAGNVVADVNANDKVDVPLAHPEVPEDGTDTANLLEHLGAGTVYPDSNFLLAKTPQVERIAAGTVNIFLHQSVRTACNAADANSFDLAKLTADLRTTMQSGGFATVNVSEKTTAQAGSIWILPQGFTRFTARNVADPANVFVTGVADNEGTDIPFFDYWVFHEASVGGAEAGDQEIINPNPGFGFNRQAKTKRMIFPIALCGGGNFNSSYGSALDQDEKMRFTANVITHEIGHGLGLRHALHFSRSGHNYFQDDDLGVMNNIGVSGGHVLLSKFSVIEKKVLKRHFL